MSNKESYKLCGFYDIIRANEIPSDATFPYPIYVKDNKAHIGIFNPGTGNIDGFYYIPDSNRGIIVRLASDIERKVGDRYLYGYRLKDNIFMAEREDLTEFISNNTAELQNDALSGKEEVSYIESLMFSRQYEACANFYRHLISIETHANVRKSHEFNLKTLKSDIERDQVHLIPNKTNMHVYALDLGNVTKGLEKRYIEPKYLKELQQNHPEFFA